MSEGDVNERGPIESVDAFVSVIMSLPMGFDKVWLSPSGVGRTERDRARRGQLRPILIRFGKRMG